MKNYRRLVIASLAFTLALPGVCEPFAVKEQLRELRGRIVRVTDGDTVLLLDASNIQIKIRLADIDAPESQMPYGSAAREYLVGLVLDKQVVAVTQKKDRYGRTVATLMLGTLDVNLAMVQAGLAWHYKRYVREQSAAQAVAYAQSEIDARVRVRGLWQHEKPTPPWEWRRTQAAMFNQLRQSKVIHISMEQVYK
jgi:endonuclease YncB( thermonuclease family)